MSGVDILGAHIRIAGGRYVAGFALLNGATIAQTWSLPSPAGDDGARLADLHRFATDLLQRHPVDALSIKGSEAGSAKALTEAAHAEGAILSAAGVGAFPSKVWTGPGYRGAVGAGKNTEVLTRAESDLTGPWPEQSERQQAAAAALAAVRKPFS